MDKMPPSVATIVTDEDVMPSFIKRQGDTLIYEIYATDTESMVRIKEFMAMYGIVDIKICMLLELELKRIMGFSDSYILLGTSTERKKYIGNAVEVTMAKVLCEALCANLIELNIKPLRVAA